MTADRQQGRASNPTRGLNESNKRARAVARQTEFPGAGTRIEHRRFLAAGGDVAARAGGRDGGRMACRRAAE
jgi:hypothetical protein